MEDDTRVFDADRFPVDPEPEEAGALSKQQILLIFEGFVTCRIEKSMIICPVVESRRHGKNGME